MVGTGDKAQETARRKRFGWGSLGALERAKRARAATWDRVKLAEEDGSMGRREAEEERQKAAGLVQQAYSGGYEHPIEVGGAVFTPIVLSPYGGWHGGCGNEQWTSRTTHTGDDAPFLSYDDRPGTHNDVGWTPCFSEPRRARRSRSTRPGLPTRIRGAPLPPTHRHDHYCFHCRILQLPKVQQAPAQERRVAPLQALSQQGVLGVPRLDVLKVPLSRHWCPGPDPTALCGAVPH